MLSRMGFRMPLATLTWLFVPLAMAQDAPTAGGDGAPAAAARTNGYEQVALADTLLFAGIDSLDQLLADWGASAYGRLLQDEAAKPVRDAFAALLESLAASSNEEIGVDAIDMVRKIDGRVGLALGGDLLGDGDGHAVVALESSGHAAELHALALAAAQKLVERGAAILKNETIGAREVVQVTPLEAGDQGRFHFGVAGTTMAIGMAAGSAVEGDHYARFLQSLDGEGGEALATRPEFAQSLAARPGGIKVWFDTGRSIRAQMTPPAADGSEAPDTRLQRALGLDQLGALAGRFVLDADEMRLDAHQGWVPVGLAQVLMAFMSGGEHALLQLMPAEAQVALSLELDLRKGLDAADALAKEAGFGPLFGEPAAEGAAPGADGDAFQPRRDLLDHLDGRVAFSVVEVPPEESLMGIGLQGGPSVSTAFVLGVRDAPALAASLDKLLRSQGLHAARRKSEFEGYVVYTIPVMPLQISYAIVDDFMVVSPSPTLLQDVLRRKSNHELPNLRRSPSFMASFDALGAQPSLAVWSSASSDLVDGLRQTMLGGTVDPGYTEGDDGSGEEFGGGAGGGEFGSESGGEEAAALAPADGSDRPGGNVEARATTLLEAFGNLDPKLLLQYLPAGQLLTLRCDATGAHLEIVAR